MDEDYDRDDVRRSDRGHNSRRHLGGMAMKRELVMRTFMLGRKGTEKTIEINDPMRFAGDGVSFKAKLIGVLEVAAPRGDRLCQEALAELKMAVKAAGEHKQRILICIALDGLRLRDERSGDCLYHHPVHKISFIAQDMTDTRAFGYIFGSPDQGHRFFGIKTDKGANTVVMAMRDLFQVVYDLKKKEIERARLQAENQALRTNGSHLATSRDSLDQTSSHTDAQYGDLLHLESELTSLQEGLHRFENFPQPASGSFDPFEEFGMHSSTEPVPIKRAENGLKTKTEPDPFTMAPFQEKVHAPSPSLTSSISSKPRTYMKELRPNSKSLFPNSEMPLNPPPLPPPLAHRSPSNKREEAKKMSTAVPRPSSSNSPALQPPQASPLRTTFCTNFNVDPFHHNDSFVASFPVSMAAKPPPSLADSPASRASQDPPFGDKYAVFAGLSEEIVHQQPNEPHESSTHLFRGPAAHLSTSNTTFEADFGDTFDFNAETEFPDSASKNNESAVFDIFTELDPLGTGKSKPYVDKKDFFKDLKKPLEKPALKVLAGEEERQAVNVPKDLQMVLETSYKQQQTPRSASQSRSAPKPAELDFEIEDTDPFGSIHFVPPPETDPFDTDITSAGVFFTPAPALPSSPLLNAKRKQFQAAESISSISFHATLPRGPLKVTLPVKEDANEPKEGRKLSPIRRSDTGSPISSRKQFTLDDSSPLVFPTLQPPPRHEKTASTTLPRPLRQASLTRQTPDTPPLPPLPRMEDLTLWRIESAQDKELRAQEQAEQQHSSQDSLNEPPDPPPRPPLVKPPPLPPKGQPPLPQRPLAATISLSSSNEDETNSSTSFGKVVDTPTPPLPTPLRKSRERQKSPLIKTDSSLSVTSSNTETCSKDKTVTKTSVKKKKHKAKVERADLSQISLVQLSSMSISQLADTLELPAERLTAMTLTELALRLNQLSGAQHGDEEEEEEQDNGEEDEEDEQEYVTLSDAPEPEDEDIENEEELENEDEVQNLVRAVTDSPPSTLTDQTEPQSAKNLDESAEDKYAALREITFASEPEVALAEQKWPTFDSPLEEEVAERRDSTSVPAFADFADFPPAELAEESKTDPEDAFDQNSDWANLQSVSRPDSVPLPVPTSATASPSFNFTSTFDDDFGRQTPAEINGVRPKATTPSFPRLSRTSESEKLGKKLTHSTRLRSRRESWNSGAGSDTEADVFGQPAWSAVEEPEADLSFGRENVLRSSGGSSGKSERRSQSQPRPSTHSPRSWVTLEVDAGPEWTSSKGISRKSSSSSHYSAQRTSPKVELPAFEDSFVLEDSTVAPQAEVDEEKARAEEEEDTFADFGAVFGNSKLNGSNGKVGTDLDAVHLTKSQSVNIFKAEGDPFDDDFFQKQSKVDTVSNAGFQTVVEDPFAWVQPFDTFHFQDEFDA